MSRSTLIIVSGLPGTGKTTLSKRISDQFVLPLVSMDAVKETMWDTMGHKFDFEFSDKIGRTAFELVFYYINEALSKGVSLVVEAHFSPKRNNERINKLKEMYDVNLLQIHCDCETEPLRKRFKERMKKDSYHKGHKHTIDLYGEERILHSLGIKDKRLDINGVTYDLDTTNPEAINYEKLFGFIKEHIK
ncbi:MAG: AAA family ATPase [Parcubacteria group bacterium]|jgi:predicted kinase